MKKGEIIAVVFSAALVLVAAGLSSASAPSRYVDGRHSPVIGKDGGEMVYVPAGYFMLGSNEGESDEMPMRKIFIDSFYLDKFEVTNREFKNFVKATHYSTTAEKRGWSWVWVGEAWEKVLGADWRQPLGPGSDASFTPNHPVIHMSWWDARSYCEWAGERLPTEMEWEKAARGNSARRYPWGNETPQSHAVYRANFNQGGKVKDGFGLTAPVGSFPLGKSPYGAMDMAGNAWEWVADWYDSHFYEWAWYKNPEGPRRGMLKVLRGGSWFEGEDSLRASGRYKAFQIDLLQSFGFRCAKDAP